MPLISHLQCGNTSTIIEQVTIPVTVHGAVLETITISDGSNIIACNTDSTGIAITNLAIGKSYICKGSVSNYTSESQLITKDTTDVYAMPKGSVYWYGNECSYITGGWSKTRDAYNNCIIIKNTNNISFTRPGYCSFDYATNNLIANTYNKINATYIRNGASGTDGFYIYTNFYNSKDKNTKGDYLYVLAQGSSNATTISMDISSKRSFAYVIPLLYSDSTFILYALWLE